MCKAKCTFNYNKPHIWVLGLYDGVLEFSCSFCGRWRDL